MSENKEKKNTTAELTDEQVDRVAGGSGDDFVQGHCPYCKKRHYLRSLGYHTMRSGMIAEAYECMEKRHCTFYKAYNDYYNDSELPIF